MPRLETSQKTGNLTPHKGRFPISLPLILSSSTPPPESREPMASARIEETTRTSGCAQPLGRVAFGLVDVSSRPRGRNTRAMWLCFNVCERADRDWSSQSGGGSAHAHRQQAEFQPLGFLPDESAPICERKAPRRWRGAAQVN